jgi:hypothetical protein
MGSLNFILAFSFVFPVKAPAIGFYCDICFQKIIHFVNFEGFKKKEKVWGFSIFFLSFCGSSFSSFDGKGGHALLL